jgi:hypothetical protein
MLGRAATQQTDRGNETAPTIAGDRDECRVDLCAKYHSNLAIALYIRRCAIVGIISTALLTDYTK